MTHAQAQQRAVKALEEIFKRLGPLTEPGPPAHAQRCELERLAEIVRDLALIQTLLIGLDVKKELAAEPGNKGVDSAAPESGELSSGNQPPDVQAKGEPPNPEAPPTA